VKSLECGQLDPGLSHGLAPDPEHVTGREVQAQVGVGDDVRGGGLPPRAAVGGGAAVVVPGVGAGLVAAGGAVKHMPGLAHVNVRPELRRRNL